MIYTLVFNLSCVYGPIGYAHHSRSEVLHFGRSLAKTALDHLGDYVNEAEWFTASGETSDDPFHSDLAEEWSRG